MNVKERQISQNYTLHIKFLQFLWNMTFIFLDSNKKFSLLLLQTD